MNKEEFFFHIRPIIEERLKSLGFSFSKSKDGYIKEIEDGWIRLYFSFYKFAGLDNFNVGFEVRKNAVEQIYVQYVDINPSNHKTVPTVIFSLTTMIHYPTKYFSFANESRLNEAFQLIVLPFIETKLPNLITKYSNIYNIYKLYRLIDEENSSFIPRNFTTQIRTIILGRLVCSNNVDFEKAIAWCDEKVAEILSRNTRKIEAEQQANQFNKLILDLRNLGNVSN